MCCWMLFSVSSKANFWLTSKKNKKGCPNLWYTVYKVYKSDFYLFKVSGQSLMGVDVDGGVVAEEDVDAVGVISVEVGLETRSKKVQRPPIPSVNFRHRNQCLISVGVPLNSPQNAS